MGEMLATPDRGPFAFLTSAGIINDFLRLPASMP
jgi:hypothetical protein